MNGNFKKALKLFITFFKIGAFTFGGGYAMIPIIQHEVVEKNHWITDDDILEIIAISESTPGPIAINSATFIGYRICGFWGSFFATLGVVLPSFVIILIISFILNEFQELKAVQYAFNGIRAGVLALLVKALVGMYKKNPKNRVAYTVIAASFVAALFAKYFGISVLWVIIGCAIFGLTTSLYADKKAKASADTNEKEATK